MTTSGNTDRWYLTGLLTAVYAFNIADRFVVSTLIDPIKQDLGLTDSGIGFLTGVSLAIFYIAVGLPLAAIADRVNRRSLIAGCLAVWSFMTMLCGFTVTYWQLLICRMGVGIGEAGGTPASHSMISDTFHWKDRAFALSIYSIGASIGTMLGSWAGYASDAWGWRSAFLVLGLPGLLLALILRLTVREPQRGAAEVKPNAAPYSMRDTLLHIIQTRALLHSLIGGTLYTLWAWGLMWWTPAYLSRSHHLTVGSAGGVLSLMHGVGGTVVLLGTSLLMHRSANREPRFVPRFVAMAIAAGTIPSVIAYSSHSVAVVLLMLWIFIPITYANFGPAFAIVQNLCPPTMRAKCVAIFLFAANLANLVLAPQLVGLASDLLEPRFGVESLRFALIPLAFTGIWAAVHYWLCGRDMQRNLHDVERLGEGATGREFDGPA